MPEEFYPAFLDITNRECVVVGGGEIAERKVEQLLASGGNVTVISPELTSGLQQLKAEGRIKHQPREYRTGDLKTAFLAIAATDKVEVNSAVYHEGIEHKVLVNSVDDPPRCSFILPAIVRRGPVTIAVSTGGKSPALAKRMREEIEEIFPPEYTKYVDVMVDLRQRVRQELAHVPPHDREEAWRSMMATGLFEAVREGRLDDVEAIVAGTVQSCLERAS